MAQTERGFFASHIYLMVTDYARCQISLCKRSKKRTLTPINDEAMFHSKGGGRHVFFLFRHNCKSKVLSRYELF